MFKVSETSIIRGIFEESDDDISSFNELNDTDDTFLQTCRTIIKVQAISIIII